MIASTTGKLKENKTQNKVKMLVIATISEANINFLNKKTFCYKF